MTESKSRYQSCNDLEDCDSKLQALNGRIADAQRSITVLERRISELRDKGMDTVAENAELQQLENKQRQLVRERDVLVWYRRGRYVALLKKAAATLNSLGISVTTWRIPFNREYLVTKSILALASFREQVAEALQKRGWSAERAQLAAMQLQQGLVPETVELTDTATVTALASIQQSVSIFII